jgi:hypothetical protein
MPETESLERLETTYKLLCYNLSLDQIDLIEKGYWINPKRDDAGRLCYVKEHYQKLVAARKKGS